MTAAIDALASWIDYEFRTRSGSTKNNWTSAMYRWFDGTGITMTGGYCETTATTFTSVLRSAGIAARPFTLDYNKTSGHGESGQIGTHYEYDHSVMMWMDNKWYAKRAYGGDEAGDLYYPWSSGTTGTSTLNTWDTYSGYYNDYYGDGIFGVNEDWTFQTSTGVGTVNTAWENGVPVPVCCYELEPVHEKSDASMSAGAIDADHDNCPCCPDENKTDSDNCSTCSYCSYYTPLTPALSANYAPAVAQLISREQITRLPDVHIPIFVPPENLS